MYDINCTHVEETIVINFLIKYITKGIIQLEDCVKLYFILQENMVNFSILKYQAQFQVMWNCLRVT